MTDVIGIDHIDVSVSDYTATFFTDPDGVRLEVTTYRPERRERHDRSRRLA